MADNINGEELQLLVAKEKVLRISNVLKLFLRNLGAQGVVKSNYRSAVLTEKKIMCYIFNCSFRTL